jgi:hypothetical protein
VPSGGCDTSSWTHRLQFCDAVEDLAHRRIELDLVLSPAIENGLG